MLANKEILRTEHLGVSFGGIHVIKNLSIRFYANELRCILGPNGAGKSTLFNLITGKVKPTQGKIIFNEVEISKLKPHQIAALGISRKFQVPNVFGEMSAFDNIEVAYLGKHNKKSLNADEIQNLHDILSLVGLQEKADTHAGALSHGEKQWLEIGMVVANRPTLMLLDEPTAGMTQEETMKTARMIQDISKQVTVIVIEHDIKFIKEIAEKITVLHQGSFLMEGTVAEISADERIKQVYLGKVEL